MTEMELAEHLTTLLGYNEEGGSSELQPFDTTAAGDVITKNLAPYINAGVFASDLLTFDLNALLARPASVQQL